MSETTTKIVVPSGRVYEVRPLPKHFFLYFGELPTIFSEKLITAMKSGDLNNQALEKELNPEQMMNTLVFIREAVNHICINPKITLAPKNENEISPFEVSEEDFNFLSRWAMSGGIEAEGLNNFRTEPEQDSSSRARGKKLRKNAK